MIRRVAFALCAFATLASGAASASPWRFEPVVSASTEYQSNPAFRTSGASPSTQGVVGLAMPATWREGRHSVTFDANGQFRGGTGETSTADASALALNAAWARGGERFLLRVDGGLARTDTLGADAPGLGVNRAAATERAVTGGAEATWLATEYDTLSLAVRTNARRFGAAPESAYVDSKEGSASVSYSHELSPRLQLLVAVGAGDFRPEGPAGRSESVNAQIGFGFQPAALWSVRATVGRSRARSDRLGIDSTGAVYDLQLTRRAELSSFAFASAQTLQSSAFGGLVRENTIRASWSRTLTPRASAGADVVRIENRQAFFGFDVFERRTESAGMTANLALSETWSGAAALRVARERYPGTLLRAAVPNATSLSISFGVSRRFGALTLR